MIGRPRRTFATSAAVGLVLLIVIGLVRFWLWDDLRQVTPLSFTLVLAATIALLASSLLVIARAALAQDVTSDESSTPRWRAALWLASLFLVVFFAKLTLMRDIPSTAPFLDQWDAEAVIVFAPFHDNSLGWPAMVQLHNEHRIFFPRLLALAVFVANGQWDPRLEQVVNAALHSLTAVVLVVIIAIANRRRRLDLFVIVAAVAFALPLGWENILMGFQSAFYLLLLFSLLALWLTTTSPAGSLPWLLGWLCAACSLFTAASGAITPLAILGVAALKLAGSPREWRQAAPDAGAAALLLALGVATASPPLAQHAALKAHTVGEFGLASARFLAWPWIDQPWAIVMWWPLAVLLAIALLRGARTTALERTVTGVGLWVILNAGALAYGRGGGGLPASRYYDMLSLGLLANAGALVALLERARGVSIARYLTAAGFAGWMLFAALGVDALLDRSMGDLGVWRSLFAAHAASIRAAMFTGDFSELIRKRWLSELPYPDPPRLAMFLQDPYIQKILPAAIRKPLHVEPQAGTQPQFVTHSLFTAPLLGDPFQRPWLSLSDDGRKATGRFVSQPLTCELDGRLRFQVSGYLGWPNQYLAIKDLTTGRDTSIVPRELARESWTDVVIPCPRGSFEIVAIDDSQESWFGFREPVEIGWGSDVAESLIQHAHKSLVAVLTMAVLGLCVRWN